MQHSKIYALCFMLMAFLACSDKETTNTSGSSRPHDPWVFRSVLDKTPRMVTLALTDDLWAAVSTNDCALYKAWKGTVFFDGPVYTQAHGPQPITIGDAYMINNYHKPWIVLAQNGDSVAVTAQYKGHRYLNANEAELLYQLESPNLPKPIGITEKMDAKTKENGQVIFTRKFTTTDVPTGYKVQLKANVSSIAVKENITTDGTWQVTNTSEVKQLDVAKVTLNVDGVLTLKANGVTNFDVSFTSPTIKNANAAGEDKEEDKDGALHEGAKLIAKADCKTCHNKNVKTIGPAYVDIAKKYQTTEDNILKLADKIKKGGAGVWGNQQMTPHAEYSDVDLKVMVSYILSLDNDSQTQTAAVNNYSFEAAPVKEDALLPGAMVKVYNIPPTTKVIPAENTLGKPKFGGVLPGFDNIHDAQFKELSDNFALYSTGYLYAEVDGEYTFEIWSDDGTKLYLHDKLIADNDGPHGTESKEAKVTLKKGYHPFRFDFYQGGGGKFLSLDWKTPKDKQVVVTPRSCIVHSVEQQGDLGSLTLPMANGNSIPGDQEALTGVHPAFTLAQARPDDFEPKVAGMDFLSDGRMVISTWDAAGSVYIIENAQSGDPKKMKVKRIAAGLAEPLGLKVVDNVIYVMQKQELTKLVDTNKDDIIDEYLTVTDDWLVSPNFHEFGFGLAYKDGFFYATLATAIEPGGASTNPQLKDRGKALKIDKNSGKIEFVSSGLRTPNGVGIGYKGEIFVADNQGDWLPSSKIVHIRPGAWFGSRSVDPEGTKLLKESPPLVWLPQDEIGNSPSTPLALNVGPYKDQMIHGEVTHGGVKRVFVEEVNGHLQGCVFRFIQGLEAGINRMAWGPDGALYVGGIGNPGNWGQAGKKWFGLQKLTYNKTSVFEMLAVRAKSNGLEIEFTEPLQKTEGWNPNQYDIRQWYYKPTINYGGPKMDDKALKVKSATVSDDRKKVFLQIDGIKPGHVVYVHLNGSFISEPGNSLWTTEAWYTMNNVPTGANGVSKPSPYVFQNNTLLPEEVADGWKLLFDGKSLANFRNFKKKTIGSSWVVDGDALHLNAVKENGKWQAKDGGDIITNDVYENFELKLEWKISNCGNSGIMFNVVEDQKYDYVWQTGPEMQILDNTCHPDTRYDKHRAGDLYDLIEPPFSTVKQAGSWNKVVIKSYKGRIQFYLNGYKVVDTQMHDKAWKDMVAKSKFKDMPDFGTATKGHISLQDHGDKVWFRNIKIRSLK